VVQIWPGQTVTCLHTNSPGHIWTTLYYNFQTLWLWELQPLLVVFVSAIESNVVNPNFRMLSR
jgi:hypothetical protein